MAFLRYPFAPDDCGVAWHGREFIETTIAGCTAAVWGSFASSPTGPPSTRLLIVIGARF
jgi:hypothetical protein